MGKRDYVYMRIINVRVDTGDVSLKNGECSRISLQACNGLEKKSRDDDWSWGVWIGCGGNRGR